jgi:transposase
MKRHELSETEWVRLAPLLPPQKPRTGRPGRDHRIIVNALLWLARTGAPWRDLPERYGPWRTVATRFYRWTKSGLWQRLLAEVQAEADAKGELDGSVHMVDGTSIRAHRHAAGAKGGSNTRHSAAPAVALAASCICAASGAAGRSPSRSPPASGTSRRRSYRS